MQTANATPAQDRRKLKNPHVAVQAAGAEAAAKGLPVHACPYVHPAMRSSWLKGFAQAKQLNLFD